MAGTRRSFVYAAAGKYTEFFLFLLGTMAMSRLLTPAEVGLFAAANSVVAFAQNIRTFGTGDFLVQREHIDDADISRAIGISFIFSWGIAAILVVFSGLIADFFTEPRMQKILIIVGASFLLLPISSVADARLMRDMKFGIKSIIGVGGALVNLGVAITLALHDYGAMSIAWATMAGNIGLFVFTVIFAGRYVSFKPVFSGAREIFTFGSWVTASAILRNIGYNGYLLIIGKILGFAALGLYMRAVTVVERFTTILLDIIRSIALPSFAELRRKDEVVGQKIVDALFIMAGFLWPIYGFVGIAAEPIVTVLYGYQWMDAIPVVKVLALSIILSFNLTALLPPILTAYGHVKLIFWFNCYIYSIRLIAVGIAVQYSLTAVAYAVVISSIASIPPYVWAMRKFYHIRIRQLAAIFVRSAFTTLLCLLPSYMVLYWAKDSGLIHIFQLCLATLAGFMCWIVAVRFFAPRIYAELKSFIPASLVKPVTGTSV